MKKTVAALIGLLTACSTPSPQVTRVKSYSSSGQVGGSLSDQIYRDVNSYRASKGKPSLERHTGLDYMAQKHCDYLVSRLKGSGLDSSSINHHGFEGRSLAARHAYQIHKLGENVVAGSNPSSRYLVDLWIGSKKHDFNMLNSWTYTGVATAKTLDGSVISTQMFATAEDFSHAAMMKRYQRR